MKTAYDHLQELACHGGAAFPFERLVGDAVVSWPGMTVRQFYAAHAVGHIMADAMRHNEELMKRSEAGWLVDMSEVAQKAFILADAMIKASDQETANDRRVRELQENIAKLEETLETLRPVWAQGHTSDSMAAQANGTALASLWRLLGVTDQTAAAERLRWLLDMEKEVS